jgi:hypothetical protein
LVAEKVDLRRVLSFLILFFFSPAAWAAGRGPVRVEVPEGELSFDGAQLIDLLRIELATDVDDARTHAPIENERVATVRVARARGADSERWIVVYRAGPGARSVQRDVDLGDAPWGARARGLALAIGEMIRSERVHAPAPSKTSEGEAGSQTAGAGSSSEATETAPGFLLLVGGRAFPSMGAWLFDPRLGFSWGSRRVRLRIDAGYVFGSTGTAVGNVAVGVPSAGLGLTLAGGDAVGFDVGPRAEIGYATFTGSSNDPVVSATTTSGVVVNVSVVGAIRFALNGDWRLGIGAEAGWVLRGLEADANGTRVVGWGGPMAGVNLQLVGGM